MAYSTRGLAVEKTRQKRLALARVYRSSKACACGESDPRCLDLHHRDPDTKHKVLRSYGKKRTRGWGEVPLRDMEAELAKCDVICSNCHRKHHQPEGAST